MKKRAYSELATRTHRQRVEFVVDGRPLIDLFDEARGFDSDLIGVLTPTADTDNATVRDALLEAVPLREGRQLFLGPVVRPGRLLLYVCPECGDIGCGAYGLRVFRDEADYVWADFGFENGYEAPRPFRGIGPFRFQRRAYERVLAEI